MFPTKLWQLLDSWTETIFISKDAITGQTSSLEAWSSCAHHSTMVFQVWSLSFWRAPLLIHSYELLLGRKPLTDAVEKNPRSAVFDTVLYTYLHKRHGRWLRLLRQPSSDMLLWFKWKHNRLHISDSKTLSKVYCRFLYTWETASLFFFSSRV